MEGHRLASAKLRTDIVRALSLALQTSMKNLAAVKTCRPPIWTQANVGVDIAKDTVVVACAAQSFPVQSITIQRARHHVSHCRSISATRGERSNVCKPLSESTLWWAWHWPTHWSECFSAMPMRSSCSLLSTP